MSKITKLPMPSSKENRAGLLNRARPAPATSAAAARALSDAEKRTLLAEHTKPWQRRAPQPVAAPSKPEPPKAKPLPKITSKFDYKGRFENLLEKHKLLRNELTELKRAHEEAADECETLRGASAARDAELASARSRLETALADLEARTQQHERDAAALQAERAMCEQLRKQTETLTQLARGLEAKTAELERLEQQHADLRRNHDALTTEVDALRALAAHLKRVSVAHDTLKLEHNELLDRAATARADAEAMQNLLASMHKEQRDLRNALHDLKGNIRVYCRVRPALPNEADKPVFNVHYTDACSLELEKVELNSASVSSRKGRQAQAFTFDGIFTPHVTQSDVFTEVAPLVQSALDGYNVCIFAYGQTGSGKTYTMEGGPGEERHGIIPRAFDMMFAHAEDLRRMGWQLTIVASFLEIYNENIYDLLEPSKEQEQHEIKMTDSKGGDVYVTNLREVEVRSCHDFVRHMMAAQRNRATAATVNNERSSRSHAVTRVRIHAVNEGRKEKLTSHLNLVDLAGSESGKTTQRMTETCNINKSLSELKNVILALRGNAGHVPYRNSKLTYLLMPSLGGNSKALMLVNVCQLDDCYAETVNSLRFAVQVNTCRSVKARKNITVVDS